jgi:hypothetical protein
MTNKPAKTWCLTLNNYTDAELEVLNRLEVMRCVFAKEVGADGTPHVQGAVTFRTAMRLGAVKKLVPRGHWEVALAESCFNYCRKEGSDVFRDENNGTKGKRSDITAAHEAAAARKSLRTFLTEEQPGLQAIKVFELRKMITPPGLIVRNVRNYFGATGTGKSHSAYTEFPSAFRAGLNSKWWSGYDGEECIIIDDYRCEWSSFEFLLRLLDPYPLQVETKGGHVWLWHTTIIFTSPHKMPDMWLGRCMEDLEQLNRRITEFREFTDRYVPAGPDGGVGVIADAPA